MTPLLWPAGVSGTHSEAPWRKMEKEEEWVVPHIAFFQGILVDMCCLSETLSCRAFQREKGGPDAEKIKFEDPRKKRAKKKKKKEKKLFPFCPLHLTLISRTPQGCAQKKEKEDKNKNVTKRRKKHSVFGFVSFLHNKKQNPLPPSPSLSLVSLVGRFISFLFFITLMKTTSLKFNLFLIIRSIWMHSNNSCRPFKRC